MQLLGTSVFSCAAALVYYGGPAGCLRSYSQLRSSLVSEAEEKFEADENFIFYEAEENFAPEYNEEECVSKNFPGARSSGSKRS